MIIPFPTQRVRPALTERGDLADIIDMFEWKWLDEALAPAVARILNGTLF